MFINTYLCTRQREDGFQLLVVYIVVGAAKTVLVFTTQSGKGYGNFLDGVNTCRHGEQ